MGHSLGGSVLLRILPPVVFAGRYQPLGPRTPVVTLNAAIGADALRDYYSPLTQLKSSRPPLGRMHCIARLDANAQIWAWADRPGFMALSRSSEALSIVCPQGRVRDHCFATKSGHAGDRSLQRRQQIHDFAEEPTLPPVVEITNHIEAPLGYRYVASWFLVPPPPPSKCNV